MRPLSELELQNEAFLNEKGIHFAKVQLTENILAHAIFDATQEIDIFLREEGIHDFSQQANGQEAKQFVPTHLLTFKQIVEMKTSLYKASKRGDRRMWFGSEIFPYATNDDIFVIMAFNNELYLINISHLDIGSCYRTGISNPIKTYINNLFSPQKVTVEIKSDIIDSEQQSEDTEEISVNSEYEPLPSGEDIAEMVSELKPAIKIKTSSKKTTEGIMYEVQDEEKHVVCEGRVCCSFPLLVMKYLMNNDYIVYNNIVQSFSTHTFFQGLQVEAYKFKDENVEIPRFFLPVKYYPSLTTHNKNRWISEVKFPIDGYNCFISNQWVGHDVEEKSNLRINDFAYMIYKLSSKKYYINFMPSGRKYNMQLVQIKKKY